LPGAIFELKIHFSKSLAAGIPDTAGKIHNALRDPSWILGIRKWVRDRRGKGEGKWREDEVWGRRRLREKSKETTNTQHVDMT